MKFKEKVVVVTGAANGIGKAIAEAYVKEGAKVVLVDIDEDNVQLLKERFPQDQILFVKTDVREEMDVIHMVEETIRKFGKIDILINNAGKSIFKPFFSLTMGEWDDTINTNLRSVFLCTREVGKRMCENGGAIINIASTRAFMSEENTESYSASKGGIIALTHALANSLSHENITVNSISPGWIETKDYELLRDIDHKQHLSNRVGKPEDIARACLFLTNSENDFITGSNLMIDGGMTVKMIYEE